MYITVGLIATAAVTGGVTCGILKSPFKYPYFMQAFDVTDKCSPRIEDYIDRYLMQYGYDKIEWHEDIIKEWKEKCKERISKSIFKRYRQKQFDKVIDDCRAYRFYFVRTQPISTSAPYRVKIQCGEAHMYDINFMKQRYKKLKASKSKGEEQV